MEAKVWSLVSIWILKYDSLPSKTDGKVGMMRLTIRKNGKYFQIGYYIKGAWINIYHIGTAEQLLTKLDIPIPETYQNV